MTVAQQITRISDGVDDIKVAIENKGVTVPASTKVDGLASLVNDIDTVDQTSALQYMLNHKTNYTGIAAGLTTLTELPAFTQPSGISVFSGMFDGCTNLTTVPTLTYPTSGSIDAYRMFRNCTSISTIPSVNFTIVDNATEMFSGCTNMAGNFSATITSVMKAEMMFRNCTKLTSATITHSSDAGSAGRLSSAYYMFGNCTSLTSASIPIGSYSGTLVDLSQAFNGCSNLKTVDLYIVPSAGNAISSIQSMCSNCSQLTTVSCSGIGSLDVSYCSTFSQLFMNCRKLTTIPTLVNTGNTKTFSTMFRGCSVLANIPQYDMSSATAVTNYVASCPALSNTSLNNIMGSLLTATSYTGTKTLKQVGLTSTQATTCTGLSNWSALSAAGWTTGY